MRCTRKSRRVHQTSNHPFLPTLLLKLSPLCCSNCPLKLSPLCCSNCPLNLSPQLVPTLLLKLPLQILPSKFPHSAAQIAPSNCPLKLSPLCCSNWPLRFSPQIFPSLLPKLPPQIVPLNCPHSAAQTVHTGRALQALPPISQDLIVIRACNPPDTDVFIGLAITIYVYNLHTAFLARKSPNVRSFYDVINY